MPAAPPAGLAGNLGGKIYLIIIIILLGRLYTTYAILFSGSLKCASYGRIPSFKKSKMSKKTKN